MDPVLRLQISLFGRENEDMAKIGLSMIVKNEASVIERCLDSMVPLIDYVLISDTGSTDGTQDIIRAWLERNRVPGDVVEEKWQDFATNRSSALQRLRERNLVDYAFVMDADETLSYEDNFDGAAFKGSMSADYYNVEIRRGSIRYWRPQIMSNGKPFCYKGVLHEYVEAPQGSTTGDASGFHITSGASGGAREKDPDTYRRDAEKLREALEGETDSFLRSRYTFYLAQSYRDSNQPEKALDAYLARSHMGYWAEEVYISLLEAGHLMERLDRPADDILATYRRATEVCSHRAEAFYDISNFCFRTGRNEEGFTAAKAGSTLSEPASGLFLSKWVYDYGLLDKLAINAYWSNHHSECVDACLKLLADGKLPPSERGRVAANARSSLAKIQDEKVARKLGAHAEPNFLEQFELAAPRTLRPVATEPRVLIAILAKQMAAALPLYLECLTNLDYPKSKISIYIRTNNNTDETETILRAWVEKFGPQYAGVEFDASDVSERVQEYALHEWNSTRFRVLGYIRQVSLQKAIEQNCEFYFTADVDNFLRPSTLRELVSLNVPIVAPFLRSIEKGSYYSNYHAAVDAQGYYAHCDQYDWVLNRWIQGVVEMPVVHCTYLVRVDVIPLLSYQDETDRHEYVIFSDTARKNSVVQYLDNRQIYGYMARDDIQNHTIQARILLGRNQAHVE